MRAEKLMKKARRAKLLTDEPPKTSLTRARLAKQLFELAAFAQAKGWSAEDILRAEIQSHERTLRKRETRKSAK